MSQATTPAAPRSASPRHSDRPTPLAPPVTTATLPLISMYSASPCSSSCSSADSRVCPGRQIRVGLDQAGELLPRLVSLGGNVLGRPQSWVRLVPLEHIAGHRDLMHLVDSVRDAHRRRAGIHR